jgi:hypothetical protein
MKATVPGRKHTARTMSILAVTALLFVVCQSTANAFPANNMHAPADTILVQKQLTNKKYKIRLYPNANHEVLFFSASGPAKDGDGKVYQLYLFDIEGNLIKQANIRNKQTTVLNNLEKGTYVFEVFSDDERIENGQLFVR